MTEINKMKFNKQPGNVGEWRESVSNVARCGSQTKGQFILWKLWVEVMDNQA